MVFYSIIIVSCAYLNIYAACQYKVIVCVGLKCAIWYNGCIINNIQLEMGIKVGR